MKHQLLTMLALPLIALLTFLIRPITAQAPLTQTQPLSQALPGVVIISVTPTASLEERVSQLEQTIHELDSPSKGYLALFLDKGDPFIWQLLIFFLVIFNRKAIAIFVSRIASVADRASIEVLGVKYTVPALSKLILEREILKNGIRIAAIDGDYHILEGELLKNKAEGMYEQITMLEPEDVKMLIQEAITMAVADHIVKDREYLEIIEIARQYNFPVAEASDMVISACILDDATPPIQLKEKFEQRKTEIQPNEETK